MVLNIVKVMTITLVLMPTLKATEEESWRVVEKGDPATGIASELYLKRGSIGEETHVAFSDELGNVSPHFICGELDILKVLPGKNSGYFLYERRCANSSTTIELESVGRVTYLVFNAIKNLEVGEYGSAALALREASARLELTGFDPEVVSSLSNSSVLATVNALNSTGDVRVSRGGVTLSQDVREDIANFQISSGIESEGTLGQPTYPTVRALSNDTVWELMSEIDDLNEEFRAELDLISDEEALRQYIQRISNDNSLLIGAEEYYQ